MSICHTIHHYFNYFIINTELTKKQEGNNKKYLPIYDWCVVATAWTQCHNLIMCNNLEKKRFIRLLHILRGTTISPRNRRKYKTIAHLARHQKYRQSTDGDKTNTNIGWVCCGYSEKNNNTIIYLWVTI